MAELNDKLITYGNLSTFYDKLQEQGLGGNAIEDASVLPDAETDKNQILRLEGDKKVYVSEYIEGSEGNPGLGFAAIKDGTIDFIWKRMPSKDNTNEDEGYENYQIAWQQVMDSYGLPFDEVTNWDDLTSSFGFTETETPSTGDVLYDWDSSGEYTVGEYEANVGYEPAIPATWAWKTLDNQPMQSITYAELKALRDNNQLVTGQQYRITDYVTTTAQANTQSAGHQFDIIVVADSKDKLNENARAIRHRGDTIFVGNKLESWELKYCLDNDTNRFSWAQVSGGTGVIYYMKDEWNNQVYFDFKNIKIYSENYGDYLYLFALVGDYTADSSLFGISNNNIVEGQVTDAALTLDTTTLLWNQVGYQNIVPEIGENESTFIGATLTVDGSQPSIVASGSTTIVWDDLAASIPSGKSVEVSVVLINTGNSALTPTMSGNYQMMGDGNLTIQASELGLYRGRYISALNKWLIEAIYQEVSGIME